MKYEMIKAMLKELGCDVIVREEFEEIPVIHVDLDDFEGFNDDWEEMYREYTHPKLVNEFLEMLENESIETDGDFYEYFKFEDCEVILGYTSFDV